MEDYSPTPDEVEETPLKKRRFLRGNFLRSWLERRENEDDSDEKDSETKETKKNWRPQRLSEQLSKIFNSLVGLEAVTETNIERSSQTDAETSPEIAENVEQNDEDYEGLLAVSPDAQMRYYGYELMDEPGLEEGETTIPSEVVETAAASVGAVGYEQVSARAEPAQKSGPTEQIGEVLRRRKTERLEKRVKKLKKQTKTLEREQAEMADKQADFAEELAKKQKAQERFEKVTVPNMEKARQRLQLRLETQTESSTPEARAAEKEAPKVEVKTEAITRANTGPEAVYEQPKQTAELPPNEQDLAKEQVRPHHIVAERDFERKHEVMDRAGTVKPLYGASAGLGPRRRILYRTPLYGPNTTLSTPRASNYAPKGANLSYQPGTSMYKQAVKTGFWSGLALAVLLLLVLMFMR